VRLKVEVRTTRQRAISSLVAGACTVVGVFMMWWVIYGRLTPGPSVWYDHPDGISQGWEWLAFVAVAAALIGAVVIAPDRWFVGYLGSATWLIVSVWVMQRGDTSGLWVLRVPIYLMASVLLLAYVELCRWARRRARE
jgi:hypothetical protein